MYRSKGFLLLCSLFFFQTSIAQTSPFEGPQVSLGLSIGSTSIKTTDSSDGSYSYEGKSFVASRIGTSYGYKLNERFVLTAGLGYDLNAPDINEKLDSAQRHDKQKSHWSLSFEPGYLINDSSLVYAKVSTHRMSIDYYRKFVSGALSGQTSTATSSHTATGFGLGYKTMLTANVGASFEVERVNYNAQTPLFVRSGGSTSNVNIYQPSTIISTASVFYSF